MTRYSWTLHAADAPQDSGSGDVYLSLHGLQSVTKALKLPSRDFASGSIDSGIVEVRGDLGELQTGALWIEGLERSAWTLDWIRIMNLSDGRQWTARGVACDAEGSCSLLQFDRTRDPSEPATPSENVNPDPPAAGDDPEMEERGSGDRGSPQSTATVVRTYEIFGKQKGRVVPLAEILQVRAGIKQLTPGAQVLVTDQESQGFGLGGEPGLWEDLYPGVDPALYGLDSDKPILASDGSRGWAVDAHYLAMIFGVNWRRVVYGN
jgi:hypothetical protein